VIGPTGITAQVTSIVLHNEQIEEAGPGDSIGFALSLPPNHLVKRGHVASDPTNDPATSTTMFLAHIIVFDHPGTLQNGYTPIIHCHAAYTACKFDKIRSRVDKRNG
jgi:elongation factor 1-alpha